MSASISCSERAQVLLDEVLAGRPAKPILARSLVRDGCGDALLRLVVEGLADRFEPRLCDAYVEIFSEAMEEALPEYGAADTRQRYLRVRSPKACRQIPRRIFVLSRVTLGADIAVTSVLLHAAKQRFPHAEILLVGSAKTAELWAGDSRVRHLQAPYPKGGSLGDRLRASGALHALLNQPESIVIDPDSRLTQLGLVPVCAEENYFFFESRTYGGEGSEALPELASRWCKDVFGAAGARPYLALGGEPLPTRKRQITVSLGVGENASKRLNAEFEAGLLHHLAQWNEPIVLDAGAGGEEAERVRLAVQNSRARVEVAHGSFGSFAARIAESSLYVGYDSAGQHAAAALSTPCVTVFAGHVSPRMFARWRPTGPGRIEIVDAEHLDSKTALLQTAEAVERIKRS